MTCFWDSILQGIFKLNIQLKSLPELSTPKNFVIYLKNNNKITNNILIFEHELRDSQKQENYDAIKSFDENSIYQGYFCSSFDPFLMLVCELFQINIKHKLCGIDINYTNKNVKKTLHLVSDTGHMSFSGVS
jgi:hypothetical protein